MKTRIVAVAVLLAGATLFAQDAEVQQTEAAQEVNKAVTTHVKTSAKSIVAKDMEAFCQEIGVTIGEVTPKDAIYLQGIEKVNVNAMDPNFVRARTMAYEKAYQKAVASYVMDKFGTEVAESFNTTFGDQSTDRLKPVAGDAKTTVERIAEKTEQLAEAKLDEGLRAMGVTPAGTVQQKRKLAVDSMIKNSTRNALGSSAGLLPVQTFEGWDAAGKYAVGVIIRGGAETETIADCLRAKQRPALVRPEAGITVKEALPSDEELVSQFGIRLFFDKSGVPALLSFAQWGSAYTGTDEDEAETALDHALKQAESLANEQLTAFINSTITIQEQSEKGEEKSTDVVFDSNGVPSEQKTMGYIDRLMATSKERGSDTMRGRSTVAKKVIVHPANGHKLAVCVRMWSFGQYDAMKRIVERPKTPRPNPGVQQRQPVVPQGTSGNRRGKTYDF